MTVSQHVDVDTDPERTSDPLIAAEQLVCFEAGAEAADVPSSIDVLVSIPTDIAVALKHATVGKLDIAAAASMVLQLYATAPLDRGSITLSSDQHARICAALGFSPQTVDQLVAGVEELVRISVGGVRIKLTAEEVGIMNARNATGLPPAEFATQELRKMFEAWRNGRI